MREMLTTSRDVTKTVFIELRLDGEMFLYFNSYYDPTSNHHHRVSIVIIKTTNNKIDLLTFSSETKFFIHWGNAEGVKCAVTTYVLEKKFFF